MNMDKKTQERLRHVIRMLWVPYLDDYMRDPYPDHVFLSLKALADWLGGPSCGQYPTDLAEHFAEKVIEHQTWVK